MRHFFFPSADSSIYSQYPSLSSGLDEILEVGKTENGVYSARSLIQFDVSQFSSFPISASYELKLTLAKGDRLKKNQLVWAFPVSESWDEGQGYFYQNVYQEPDGTTWISRTSGSSWSVTGSTFLASAVSGTISNSGDLSLDITLFVRDWISGSYPNNGLVLKFNDDDEQDTRNRGRLYFFSKDTHTIFSPILVAKWMDQTVSPGPEATLAPESNIAVTPFNLRPKYKQNETVRVDLSVREQYPQRTWTNYFNANSGSLMYLPTSSFFSIIDAQSNTSIIPFDDYSRINVDASGSFIKFKTQCMFPNRYYKVIFKTINDNYEQIFDNNYIFSISQ